MDTFEEINVLGFVDEEIDPTLDLFDEIEKLKKQKNAVILAH
jgi:quinolinate synthase